MGRMMVAHGAALVALLAPAALGQGSGEERGGSTRMRMEILPDTAGDSTDAVLGRLRAAMAVGAEGISAAESYGGLLGNIQPESLSATTARDPKHAAVDIRSDRDVRAHADGAFSAQAGADFRGRIQGQADVATAGLDLQSLGSVGSYVGDDAELNVLGDLGVAAAQSASVRALQLDGLVMGNSRAVTGADVGAHVGGDANLRLGAASATLRGDLSVAGAKLNIAGTKDLSMIAGADVDIATPGGVKLGSKGGTASIGGDGHVEFVAFAWRSTAQFDVYENALPEAVAAVAELLIRADPSTSPAEVASDAGGASVAIALGEADTSGAVSVDTVWSATIGAGTFSLDGLKVSLSRQYTVSTVRLSSTGGDDVFRGWSEVEFLLGVGVANGVKVASAANLEATTAKGMRLVAGKIAASASSNMDLSTSSSARVVAQEVSTSASRALQADAASMSVQAADRIEAFTGGALSASTASVKAEARGAAVLSAAGEASLAAESGQLGVTGELKSTAARIKLNADVLETAVQDLSVGVAQTASLYTMDAALSSSGTVSAYADKAEILAEGDFAMRSAGDVSVRSRSSIMDTADDMALHTGTLSTTTSSMRVRAGGGARPSDSKAEVEIYCEGTNGGCVEKEEQLQRELAEMLGVPVSRLRVSSL